MKFGVYFIPASTIAFKKQEGYESDAKFATYKRDAKPLE